MLNHHALWEHLLCHSCHPCIANRPALSAELQMEEARRLHGQAHVPQLPYPAGPHAVEENLQSPGDGERYTIVPVLNKLRPGRQDTV